MVNILLAEDDADLNDGLGEILQIQGHQVVRVTNGNEAWEQLQATHFDILITDYDMPYLKGDQIIKKLSKIKALDNLYIIMISGFNIAHLKSNPRIHHMFYKPFDILDILALVNQYDEQKSSR